MTKVKAIIILIIALFCTQVVAFAKTAMTPADIKAFNDAKTLCGCKPSKTHLNFRRALAKSRIDAGLPVTPWQEHLAKELPSTIVAPTPVETEPIVVEIPKVHTNPKLEATHKNIVGPINKVAMFALLALLIVVGIVAFEPKRRQKPKTEKFILLSAKPEINYAVSIKKEEPADPKPPMLSPVACDLKLYGTNDYFEQGEKLKDADEYFNRFIRLST